MASPAISTMSHKRAMWLGVLVVTLLGYFTYMHNYTFPSQFFWDENYHMASAQKYLNGVYFMEPHPPLGKLLIAAGEKLVHANAKNDQFIGTDYAGTLPMGFSFAGYRLFPVLLAWLAAPLFFFIFYFLTRNPLHSTLLSFLYVFDNAMIVHLRGAMLEGPLLFFSALTVLAFLLMVEWRNDPKRGTWAALLFGAAFACAVTTKVFALIFFILAVALMILMRKERAMLGRMAGAAFVAFMVVFAGVWQIHFSIASNVNPNLPDDGYYQASEQYKEILKTGATSSPASFFIMLRDHVNFVSHYERGVPKLDVCKSDENGSPFFLWPFGATTINYRWETPDGSAYQYLYLQSNPVAWGIGLLSLIVAFSIVVSSWLVDTQPQKKPAMDRFLLLTFLALYVCFMIAVGRITRVMYLYHYFLPLTFTWLLFPLVLQSARRLGPLLLTPAVRTSLFLTMALLTFLGFQFYRPLTYYEPIGDDAFKRRMLLGIWELRCVRCDQRSVFGVPHPVQES